MATLRKQKKLAKRSKEERKKHAMYRNGTKREKTTKSAWGLPGFAKT